MKPFCKMSKNQCVEAGTLVNMCTVVPGKTGEGKDHPTCDNPTQCKICKKWVCYYHMPPNYGGIKGGHTCKEDAPTCQISAFWTAVGVECGGKVVKCPSCEFYFCEAHIATGAKTGEDRGHYCDIGCCTTLPFKIHCKGTRQDLKTCKYCESKKSPVMYCPYHLPPVNYITSTGDDEGTGGHVCKGFTGGSVFVGDSAGEFFAISCDAAVTIATVGTVNPLAPKLALNAMKVVIDKATSVLGDTDGPVITPMKNALQKIKELGVKHFEGKQASEWDKVPDTKFKGNDATGLLDDVKGVLEDIQGPLEKVDQIFGSSMAKKVADLLGVEKSKSAIVANVKAALLFISRALTVIDLCTQIVTFAARLEQASNGNPQDVIKVIKDGSDLVNNILTAAGAYDKPNAAKKKSFKLDLSRLDNPNSLAEINTIRELLYEAGQRLDVVEAEHRKNLDNMNDDNREDLLEDKMEAIRALQERSDSMYLALDELDSEIEQSLNDLQKQGIQKRARRPRNRRTGDRSTNRRSDGRSQPSTSRNDNKVKSEFWA